MFKRFPATWLNADADVLVHSWLHHRLGPLSVLAAKLPHLQHVTLYAAHLAGLDSRKACIAAA
jgi:hypothetical protein